MSTFRNSSARGPLAPAGRPIQPTDRPRLDRAKRRCNPPRSRVFGPPLPGPALRPAPLRQRPRPKGRGGRFGEPLRIYSRSALTCMGALGRASRRGPVGRLHLLRAPVRPTDSRAALQRRWRPAIFTTASVRARASAPPMRRGTDFARGAARLRATGRALRVRPRRRESRPSDAAPP